MNILIPFRQHETSAKAPLLKGCHPERSEAKSKDQFSPAEKRQTELILRQAQEDGTLKERVLQRAQRLARMAFLLAALLILGTVHGLAAATISQQIQPEEVSVGDQINVTITVQNGTIDKIQLPPVDGLQVMGTFVSNGITIVNSSMSSTSTQTFIVAATHAGDFTIPAFKIHTKDGQSLDVKAMKLHVLADGSSPSANASPAPALPTFNPPNGPSFVPPPPAAPFNPNGPVVMPPPGTAPTPNAGNSTDTSNSEITVPKDKDGNPAKVFLIISPKTTDAYVGESIPLRIDFYIRVDAYSDQNSLPTVKGSDFLMNNFSVRGHGSQGELEGVQYIRERWVTAISAPKSGDFPLQVERDTYWARESPLSFGGFIINQSGLAHETIGSNKLLIHVHSLPTEGRPANFSGAIGQLKVTGHASPETVAVGEPVTLQFTVTGEGNFDYVKCPTLVSDPAWKTYVPSSKIEYIDESHTQGTKTFEQAIIPQKNGNVPLPEGNFSYFDPASKRYVTVNIALPEVTVTGTVPAASSPDTAATLPSATAPATAPKATELIPNRLDIGSLQTSLVPVYRQPWFWAVQGGMVVLLLLGVTFVFVRSRVHPNTDLAEQTLHQRSLNQEQDAMSEAVRQGDARTFFLAARHAVQLHLATRWRVKPETLTLREIDSRDPKLAATLEPLFQQADEAIYSGRASGNIDLAEWERRVRQEYLA